MNSPVFDGLALGGGKSQRMGTNKVLIPIEGRALLKTAIEALEGARKLALVAPADVVDALYPTGVPNRVVQTLEDPPFGGPVAGIHAGLTALEPEAAPIVGIVAGDHPRSPRVLAALRAEGALEILSSTGRVDGVCAVDESGFRQPLLGFYRRDYLVDQISGKFGGSGRGVSVKRLLLDARLELVLVPQGDILDLDSPEDLQHYRRLRGGHAASEATDDQEVQP